MQRQSKAGKNQATREQLAFLRIYYAQKPDGLVEHIYEQYALSIAQILRPHFPDFERSAGVAGPNRGFRRRHAVAACLVQHGPAAPVRRAKIRYKLSQISGSAQSIASDLRNLHDDVRDLPPTLPPLLFPESGDELPAWARRLDAMGSVASGLTEKFAGDVGGRTRFYAYAVLIKGLARTFEATTGRKPRYRSGFIALTERVLPIALKLSGKSTDTRMLRPNSPDARQKYISGFLKNADAARGPRKRAKVGKPSPAKG
jgi:hypothetical protein